jgi:zinc transport system ATP-binding protein
MSSLLSTKNLSYSINWIEILHNVSCTIEEHQVVSIIWYNGSEKSTLLQLLLWSLQPTSWLVERKPGLRIGYVPQKRSFTQKLPLTVKDFLLMYNKDIKATYACSCTWLDITPLLDVPLSGLSWGQLQKVLIYNALVWNPDVLLLDEPTAWLDVLAQKEFYGLLEHIHQEHKMTLVMVSHDMHTVYSKSDAVICLHQGMCCTGSPHDASFSDDVKELFGGYVLPYLHTHGHTHDR